MIFEQFSRLKDQHAILGASQHAWLNYSDEKLISYINSLKAKEMGTRLHALAAEHIELGIRMPKSDITLNKYINDAITHKMTPEQILYFSDHAFSAVHFQEAGQYFPLQDFHIKKHNFLPALPAMRILSQLQ